MRRRQFVKTGGTLLTAGAVGLSGCGGILDGDGDTSSFGDVAGWVPAPELFDTDLHYRFRARSPAQLAEVSDGTFWDSSFSQSTTFGTLPAEDVEHVIRANASMEDTRNFTVYAGSFDAEWVGTKLRQQEFSREGSYQGYTLYTAGRRGFAVTGDAVISAQHEPADSEEDPDPSGLAETIIDTDEGTVDAYADTNEDMGALADTLSGGHAVRAGTFERIEGDAVNVASGNFENLVGRGRSSTVQGTESNVSVALVFLDGRDVREREIETYIDESGEFTDFHERPEYEIDGRTVEITGTVSTGSVSGLFGT